MYVLGNLVDYTVPFPKLQHSRRQFGHVVESLLIMMAFLYNDRDAPMDLRLEAAVFHDAISEYFNSSVDYDNDNDNDDDSNDFDKVENAEAQLAVSLGGKPLARLVIEAYSTYERTFVQKFNGARHMHERVFDLLLSKAHEIVSQ